MSDMLSPYTSDNGPWNDLGGGVWGSAPVSFPTANLLVDTFESGDLSNPDSNSTNWAWTTQTATSLVSDDTAATPAGTDGLVVFSSAGAVIDPPTEVAGKDWVAIEGSNSMRFRYAAGNEMVEQRFSLDAQTDLWGRYWIRVPVNYSHGSLNNKLLALWPETYDVQGTVTWQTRPDGSDGANLVVQDGGVVGGEQLSTPFISVPADRGRWMQIVFHVKSATSAVANDGEIQFYRRWDGEPSFTKLHEILDANTFEVGAGSQGIATGYFFGWANDPYDVNTEWLLDKVELSTSTLI